MIGKDPRNPYADIITKIVVITKEHGKLIFIQQEDWANFSIVKNTLHSASEPAYQEYYVNLDGEKRAKFVWFYNGLHHRPNAPAVYRLHNDTHIYNNYCHDFEFLKGELIVHNGHSSAHPCNIQLYLNGVQYYESLKSLSKFMHDSKRFMRGNKLREIFNEVEL